MRQFTLSGSKVLFITPYPRFENGWQIEKSEVLFWPCPFLSVSGIVGKVGGLGASLSDSVGLCFGRQFSVDGAEVEESRAGSCRCYLVTPRSKAKCHRKVASSAIALQSERNAPQPPEVKEHLSGEEETLVVSRD